ncbi:Oidioi.mRNA.OKI2018_I69.XSR.g16865.t1.cds [Oikopleura dioica]|uniref:Oidioi.mRNA.OKI2018_I69.XSR.g16865.t1.cds n=1 Tax=Oikopleura dioica TaxID=34765 RepID=A0ABN7SLB0_OIKDI|nr:Oidioi.mRNA.OKI2018_I69.XSR.g16865.t1.cds [Oikopleura dioica]
MDELLCKAKEVNPELTLEVIFTDSLDEINGSEQFVESLKKQGKLQDVHFLLDLNVLGRSNPKIFATSETTKVEFDHIRAVEKRLKESGSKQEARIVADEY